MSVYRPFGRGFFYFANGRVHPRDYSLPLVLSQSNFYGIETELLRFSIALSDACEVHTVLAVALYYLLTVAFLAIFYILACLVIRLCAWTLGSVEHFCTVEIGHGGVLAVGTQDTFDVDRAADDTA